MTTIENLKTKFHEYHILLALGMAALMAELAYAVLNLSGMPVYVQSELGRFSEWGLIYGTFLGAEALSRPALGALGDKIGRKPLMLAGPAITAITAYLSILYKGPFVVPYLIVLRALDGLGSSALWMNAFAAVGDVVGENHRSTAMSVLNVTYMGGMSLGFLLGGFANEMFHTLTASFYLASILFVMSFVILLLFFPKAGTSHHTEASGEEVTPDFKLSHVLTSFKEVPDMIVMAMVTFVGMGMLSPIVKVYAIQHLGLKESTFGLAVAPIAAAMGVFAIPMGRLGDKYGKTTAVCWGLFASAIAMWILAFYKILWLIGIAGVMIGLGFTAAFPAWNALVISTTDPKRRGAVLGAVGLAQGVAAWLGTILGPVIYESDALSFPRLGIVNYNVPFWISAIAISAGSVICFTWVCSRRLELATEERITCSQRQRVQWLAIVGLIALVGWISWRYTMPIPPDRVAWSWVQQVARQKPQKALKFSAKTAPGWNANETIRRTSRDYHRWVYTQKASYSVSVPEYVGNDRSEVTVNFRFPAEASAPRSQTITLCKTAGHREWQVCGVR